MTIHYDLLGPQWGRIEHNWTNVKHVRMEVHHDVYPRHPDPIVSARRIQTLHENNPAYNGIFYCAVLHHSGVLLEARGTNKMSKGNRSDGKSFTTVLTGNYETVDHITEPQAEVLRNLDRHFAEPTVWHKQRGGSACPGKNAISWLEHNLGGEPQPGKGAGPVIYGPGYTTIGPGVEKIQQMLKDLKVAPSLVVDVDYGPLTVAAVREWQKRLGITVDGIWGPATQTATDNFFNYLAKQPTGLPSPPPKPVGNRLVVAEIRRKMSEVDGLLGQIR